MSRKKKYFYTRRDRHHFLSRNRKYRQANVLRGLYAARGGPRIGFIAVILILVLGLLVLPTNYINDESRAEVIPIGTPAPRGVPAE